MTLDEALNVLLDENIGDRVYDIRERVLGDNWCKNNPNISTWEHPRVIRWSLACTRIREHLGRERGTEKS